VLRTVVVVPATPLLVRGASGRADPLARVRDVVGDVLARELAAAGSATDGGVAVLGVGPTTRAARLRPTLAAAGIADRLVPDLRDADEAAWEGSASTGPSVALLVLAHAGLDPARTPVDVVEVPAEAATADVRAVVERLRRARLVVVADHPAPGVDAVIEALTAVAPRAADVTEVPQRHEHLPASYRVTVHRVAE
jgi:hypothetical protein